MSFVIPVASHKEPASSLPGPGQYINTCNRKPQQNSAPFNSTCQRKPRKTKSQKETIVPPGPGSYDPGLYNQRNTVQSSFKSKSIRFSQNRVSTEPGPGSYNHQSLSPKKVNTEMKNKVRQNPVFNMMFAQNQNRKQESIKQPSHYVRVVFKNPNNDNVYVSQYVDTAFIVNKQIGPGQYDPDPSFDKKNHGTEWSKSKARRFEETVQNNRTGPGSYNPKFTLYESKSGAKAAFRSQNAKSYFDSEKFKSCHQPYIDLMNKLDIKDDTPGPGNYEIQSGFKQKQSYVQSFGSESIRFLGPTEQSSLGPGSYNFDIKVDKPQPLVIKLARRRRCKSEIQNKSKQQRPHSYQASSNTIHENLYKLFKNGYYGHFGSKVDRFKSKASSTPGPGMYNTSKKQKQISNTSYIANSKRVDELDIKRKQDSPFLTYNLNMYDIGRSLEKKQDFLKNLELVEVKKPAFQSSVQRFENHRPSYDAGGFYPKKQEEFMRNVKEKINKVSASFKSTTKRSSIEPWDNATPPPGYYHRELKLEKLSYNMKYGFIEKVEKDRNRGK